MEIGKTFDEKSKELDSTYPKHVRGEDQRIARNEELKIFNRKKGELISKFKVELLKHYGVSKNPKAQQLYEEAWEQGHSGGFNEVEIYFSDRVQQIKQPSNPQRK